MEEALAVEMERPNQQIEQRAAMILDPDTGFGDKFEAVMLIYRWTPNTT